MKKIASTLSFVFVVASAMAQMEAGIGIKGGLNAARFNTKYQFDDANEGKTYTNRAGFHAGVFANFKTRNFVIQPELLYSQQGSYFKYDPTNDNEQKWTAKFNYVTIPLTVKYTIFQLDEGDLNVQLGAQYGRLLKAWANYYDFDGDGAEARHEFNTGKTGDDVFNVKDDYKASDLGLHVGLGWELPMGLSMDVRYYLGLQFMNAAYDGSRYKDYGSKNRVLQISIAYRIFRFDL
ncbi:MAG: PorT family protein [Cytophagales bacterium]|nr:PorT family protein [Cytophagales bacterium]